MKACPYCQRGEWRHELTRDNGEPYAIHPDALATCPYGTGKLRPFCYEQPVDSAVN